MKKPEEAYLKGKTENQGYPSIYSKSCFGWRCAKKSVYTSLKNWFVKKIQHIWKGLGSKIIPVKHFEVSV